MLEIGSSAKDRDGRLHAGQVLAGAGTRNDVRLLSARPVMVEGRVQWWEVERSLAGLKNRAHLE